MPIKEAVLAEISRDVPEKFKSRVGFVMSVYGCSVFEDYIDGRGFTYTAVNDDSGKAETITRRRNPLPTSDSELVKFALKVRDSRVGGLGRYEVAEGVKLSKWKTIVRFLFREVLPKYGYKIREEQIALAEELLDAIAERRTLLAEAPTGLGKTLVYIIIGALVRRSQINKTWNSGYFPGMSCVEWLRMGVLVSTSSIALQKAVYTETIPAVSDILVDFGIIREPLMAVLRKGKEHYVCEYNLREYLPFESDPAIREELERLAIDGRVIDLAEIDGLAASVKSNISVPPKCHKNCPFADDCRYRAFRDGAKKTGYDFVICNHQLLLADMKLRAETSEWGRPKPRSSILPPFQVLVLDEAHKVLPAARSLYGSELTADAIPNVTKVLFKLNFAPLDSPVTDSWKVVRDKVYLLSGKIYEVNKRLFSRSDAGIECDHIIRKIRDLADSLVKCLLVSREFEVERDEQLKHSLLWELRRISKSANELFDSGSMIRWFVNADDTRTAIGGIPKELNRFLYDDLWQRGIPGMLTSGTLSVGGDFTALKQSLGLDSKNVRLAEVTHSSPFNYKENCLLYLSKNVPDYRDSGYIAALTDELERLIKTSHGHAAVLFTSYRSMRVVHGRLKKRMPEMKDFVLERSTSTAIERFKASGNGVLFACGSMWEGIDCAGDILSLLVIVKLPFAQPNAISEYEQTRYPNFGAYFDGVLMPDMLIKTKQAFGRGFRLEDDTCVVACCDIRAFTKFREPLLDALPECDVTDSLEVVANFYRDKKDPDYFI
jgi:ATP-dependent DNA helicase DinG